MKCFNDYSDGIEEGKRQEREKVIQQIKEIKGKFYDEETDFSRGVLFGLHLIEQELFERLKEE